jgi:periplasmic divalent cation tolerance protein
MADDSIYIAWTTVATEEEAVRLAESVIQSRLAACVQVDQPVQSMYPWKGRVERETEIRIWIKYPSRNDTDLQELMAGIHPYETPQWIAVRADAVSTDYAEWVIGETSH